MPKTETEVLVADIGGTNCRLALVAATGAFEVKARFACTTSDFTTPGEAIKAFLQKQGSICPRHAALSLAAPTKDEPIQLTNSRWRFSRAELAHQLGLERIVFLNDLAAQARAILDVPNEDIAQIGDCRGNWHDGTIAVVGPGTGLGVAMLDPQARNPVTPTEGGHVGFAPNDGVEMALLRAWCRQLDQVTNEHIISGPGLVRIYRALAEVYGTPVEPIDGPEIMQRALAQTDIACVKAVDRFAKIFGSVCADVVLAQGAQALALVGTIATSMQPILQLGGFRQRFDARGPGTAFLKDTPCLLVTTQDLGLRGAAAALRDAPAHKD
jgi:glucokinase